MSSSPQSRFVWTNGGQSGPLVSHARSSPNALHRGTLSESIIAQAADPVISPPIAPFGPRRQPRNAKIEKVKTPNELNPTEVDPAEVNPTSDKYGAGKYGAGNPGNEKKSDFAKRTQFCVIRGPAPSVMPNTSVTGPGTAARKPPEKRPSGFTLTCVRHFPGVRCCSIWSGAPAQSGAPAIVRGVCDARLD